MPMPMTFAAVRGAVLAACLTATACTSYGPATRSSPPPSAPRPTASSPAPPQPVPPPAPPRGVPPITPPSSPAPVPPPSTVPGRSQSDVSGASGALLAQSRRQRAAGSYAEATALIERALRLDPNNAELWIERGELALQTGSAAQAATMARKALTLTAGDRALEARAQQLLRASGAR
jgi:hypothetical protein